MNQNFGFMDILAPILFKRKIITNRGATDHRKKCYPRNLMHCFSKLRTKDARFLGDGLVLKRPYWTIDDIPDIDESEFKISPLEGILWSTFAYIDGFSNFTEFIDYFQNHKKAELGFLCFYFIKFNQTKITDFTEIKHGTYI